MLNSALLHLTLPISWLYCPYFQFIFSIHCFLLVLAFCQSLTSFYFLTSNSLFILFLQTCFHSVLDSILDSFLLWFPFLFYCHWGSLHLIFYYGNFLQLTVKVDRCREKFASRALLNCMCLVPNAYARYYPLRLFKDVWIAQDWAAFQKNTSPSYQN